MWALIRMPKVGQRVQLVRCNDPYATVPIGTHGTVRLVDAVGTVHINWDNGSDLGLCPDDGDIFIEAGFWNPDNNQVGDLVVSKSVTQVDRTIRVVTKVEYRLSTGAGGERWDKWIHVVPPDRNGATVVVSSHHELLSERKEDT